MRYRKPINFRATFSFVLPSHCKYIFGSKPFRLGKYRFKFDGGSKVSANVDAQYPRNRKSAPLRGKSRFLMEIVNGSKDKRRYRTTDRFFKEKEVESAVEWFKKQIKRETVRIGGKGQHVRLEDVLELVERAFGDV